MCWENVWFKGFYGNFVNFVYESFVIVICFFWSINPDFCTLVAWRGSLAQKMLGNGRELITRDSETCTYVPIRMADRSKYPDNSYQMPPFCLKYTQIIFFFKAQSELLFSATLSVFLRKRSNSSPKRKPWKRFCGQTLLSCPLFWSYHTSKYENSFNKEPFRT